MKSSLPLLALGLLAGSCAAQSPAPASPEKAAPAAEKVAQTRSATPLAALARYKGKAGKPANNVMTATRSGDQPAVRLVAIAPGDSGVTEKEAPRLWWHQSHDTRAGELEFVLSELSASGSAVLLRRPVPPMSKGFNVIDLSHPKVNPVAVKLKVGGSYQWTINLRNGTTNTPVYCRLRMELPKAVAPENEGLDKRLGRLAESGNWYELFDAASSSGQVNDDLRFSLMGQIGLSKEVISAQ